MITRPRLGLITVQLLVNLSNFDLRQVSFCEFREVAVIVLSCDFDLEIIGLKKDILNS